MLDTGSSSNLISKDFLKANFSYAKTKRTNVQLTVAVGEPKSLKTARVPLWVRFQEEVDIVFKLSFLIIEGLRYPMYIGAPFLQHENFLGLDSEGIYI